MDYIFESMVPSVIAAAVVAIVFLTAFLQTGRYWSVAAMVASVALILVGGWAADHWVLTDREAIVETLDSGARAAESNDLARVLSFVEEGAVVPASLAAGYMEAYTLKEVHISASEIEINELTTPPSAEARVTVRVSAVKDSGSEVYPIENAPFRITLQMRKHGDRWLVYGATNPEPVRL